MKQILVYKTEQYPLPAMHLDKSSLEGTLQVLSHIFKTSLNLSKDDLKSHGIVICAGDQLSLSLLDKVCVAIVQVMILGSNHSVGFSYSP